MKPRAKRKNGGGEQSGNKAKSAKKRGVKIPRNSLQDNLRLSSFASGIAPLWTSPQKAGNAERNSLSLFASTAVQIVSFARQSKAKAKGFTITLREVHKGRVRTKNRGYRFTISWTMMRLMPEKPSGARSFIFWQREKKVFLSIFCPVSTKNVSFSCLFRESLMPSKCHRLVSQTV